MDQELTLDQMQPIVYQQLQRSFEHERLAHAYLFEGEKGTGKHEMGIWLAQHLFCTNQNKQLPCGVCNNCQRIKNQEHPDVLVIQPEGQTIKVDQIRRLQTEFSRSGYESRKKVFLIQEAEKMNASAANSLLKFLEEPPGEFLAILETDAIGRILPTIQSRCQILHFQELPKGVLIQKLQQAKIPLEKAKLLAFLTNSFGKAVEISEDEWFNDAKDSIYQWFVYLQKNDTQAFIYVQKKLTKIFKEKSQQFTGLSILLFYYQEALKKDLIEEKFNKMKRINQTIERILIAEQKLRSNVSFQAIAEQFVLQTINE
ncbi:DNA polymerase III subunit delta' [Enterococcus villorum]|uniref:DNA polymerase III subunit delta n=2 Tax=Enterococcus villorum TaxID=112904 RepID=A0A511J443_9ENTE|nr:DNA polymerase III subunit delta' [Enterococcus villorum]EOH85893.1 DNA polymerase III, delta' subunit [Enterococcus villorum ATCC 700913]EOW78528.1 DNA polymerase III, delta' subunit [Enterococcus villorum ATCC 700913]GEL92473.1 DNA polymerase III subunit delta' [Enterococcus villorum]